MGRVVTLPWTSDAPVPDVKVLPMVALVRLWRANRNGLLGVMASDEVCRRLTEGKR